jgi:hypothetical protein
VTMALADALEFAAKRWTELRDQLSRDDIREIERVLAAAVHGATWDPGHLIEVLLASESSVSPAWSALRESATRRAGPEPQLTLVAAAHLRLAIELAEYREPRRNDPRRITLDAEERLFTAPMRDIDQEEPPPNVVVLRRRGERFAPSFQFDGEGLVLENVARVNEMLDATDDPWGVASWWLTPHAALHAIPADEVRVGNAENVVAAARAIETLP